MSNDYVKWVCQNSTSSGHGTNIWHSIFKVQGQLMGGGGITLEVITLSAYCLQQICHPRKIKLLESRMMGITQEIFIKMGPLFVSLLLSTVTGNGLTK